MEFDKSRVYTALNADEVKIGSKVICANNINSLKRKVNDEYEITEIKEILLEDNERRFRTKFSGLWPLVYLVSEPEENKLKWTDLKLGDKIRKLNKNGTIMKEAIVIHIDRQESVYNHSNHINCGQWICDRELEQWEKVEE